MSVDQLVDRSLAAKLSFAATSEDQRVQAISEIAVKLMESKDKIIQKNKLDIDRAVKSNLSDSMIDRLKLDAGRIEALIEAVRSIAHQPQVVGEVTESIVRPDGLKIQKQRIPLGVIGMIFESRPNVVIDCSCLALKSGNCIILKGGKEAAESNRILTQLVQEAIAPFVPRDCVQLIETREDVQSLLSQVGKIDVIIPRGGESLINYVYANSKIPVIAHFKGLCHIFIDESAELKSAKEIVLNAKVQRPGVCNAVETLILHKNLPKSFVDDLFQTLKDEGVELRICTQTKTSLTLKAASKVDWETEYLDKILSVKSVENCADAIKHIQRYGSFHTEAILSQDTHNIEAFKTQIDASSIMVNASTRFNDGGEYGLGAELGISTTKLHAYGPMGAREMTTQRFVVVGEGHIRK